MECYDNVRSLSAVQTHEEPWLECFLNPIERELGRRYRKAVIVCSGGGYGSHTVQEEYMVALRFQSYGFQSFVLHYSVGKKQFPKAMNELADAIVMVRDNSSKWDINPDGITVCGFSAGGHLAASLAVHCESKLINNHNRGKKCKPDAIILCYPIITTKQQWAHTSFVEEMCIDSESNLYSFISVENYVNKDMCPCFIWHNVDDPVVSVMNSILFIERLSFYHIPFESHLFIRGGHFLGLADDTTAPIESYINDVCAQWVPMAIRWLKEL